MSHIISNSRGRRHFPLLSLSFPVVNTDLLLSSNVQGYLRYLDVIFLCRDVNGPCYLSIIRDYEKKKGFAL